MGRGRPKKNKFDDLDSSFKDGAAAMSEEQIHATLVTVSLNHAALMAAKADDEALKEAKGRASEAGAVYRDGSKQNRLKTDYLRQILGDRGKENGSFDEA